MLTQALYNIVDSIFVSFVDESALTAVTLSYPIFMLMIAVAVGMLPTKGMPLPLVSYGGSAMMAAGVQVGILLALSREART